MRENELIAYLRQQLPEHAGITGVGDDCCVWSPDGRTCLSTDTVVEGRHFATDADPDAVARKAAGAAISDLAAMGARPVGCVVAIATPERWDRKRLMDALVAVCRSWDCPILGGDTTGSEQLVITVTVWGELHAERFLLRDGAREGDLLVVTGPLGGSLDSGRHLDPQPRLAQGAWLAERPEVHACLDLSDGLATDAARLAAASGLGAVFFPDKVPVHHDVPEMSPSPARAACCDGEDFELLFALEPGAWPRIHTAWPFEPPLAEVGWFVKEQGLWMEDRGRIVPCPWTGFEH